MAELKLSLFLVLVCPCVCLCVCVVCICQYDPRFGDAFWNSSKYNMVSYLLRMMTSWAIVVNVWYLPPMTIQVHLRPLRIYCHLLISCSPSSCLWFYSH